MTSNMIRCSAEGCGWNCLPTDACCPSGHSLQSQQQANDATLIHTSHGREALTWILPMKGVVSEWPSPWHHYAATAIMDPERLAKLAAAELIRRGHKANACQWDFSLAPKYAVWLDDGARGVSVQVNQDSMRRTRHALLAIMQAPEEATRDDLAKLMLSPPDATAAKREADSLAVSKAQNLVVKADDILDGVDTSVLTSGELADLTQAIGSLRDLSRKLTARHQGMKADS